MVVLLKSDLFPDKSLFATSTLVVVYFTILVLGMTIEPVVKTLQTKNCDNQKSSTMTEQLQNGFIEHLTRGIEDIAGSHSSNTLKEKFAQLNQKYLKGCFTGPPEMKTGGLSIVKKLMENDVKEVVKGPSSLYRLHQLTHCSAPARLLDLHKGSFCGPAMGDLTRTTSLPNTSVSFTSQGADIKVIENAKNVDNSSTSHIFEANMFTNKKRFVCDTRNMLPEYGNATPDHHKEKLPLHHLISHRRTSHHGNHHSNHHHHANRNHSNSHCRNGSDHSNSRHSHSSHSRSHSDENVNVKERDRETHVGDEHKHVSFVDMREAGYDDSQDAGSNKANDGSDYSGSDPGIVFIADTGSQNSPLGMSPKKLKLTTVQPTAAELLLPWKRDHLRAREKEGEDHIPWIDDSSSPDSAHDPLHCLTLASSQPAVPKKRIPSTGTKKKKVPTATLR